jgi:hypothetical protein
LPNRDRDFALVFLVVAGALAVAVTLLFSGGDWHSNFAAAAIVAVAALVTLAFLNRPPGGPDQPSGPAKRQWFPRLRAG